MQLYKVFSEFARVVQTGTVHSIDYFPILKWLPGFFLPVKYQAKASHIQEKRPYLEAWLQAKKSIQEGTVHLCFCIEMARQQRKIGFDEEQAAYSSGTLLEAGSDTTSNTLYGFVQAMVLFPEVQQKAQEEIDKIVGHERMPNMDDEPKMQYNRGCVKESLRWMPTAIVGSIPHALTQDDEYMGYSLPKGAGVVSNIYKIHMDPARYPEPRKFNLDRYQQPLRMHMIQPWIPMFRSVIISHLAPVDDLSGYARC